MRNRWKELKKDKGETGKTDNGRMVNKGVYRGRREKESEREREKRAREGIGKKMAR